MKIVFIARSTLFTAQGGDTQQVMQTARHLQSIGIDVEIKLAHEKIDYSPYDLVHFFNIIRPADMLFHIHRSKKPFVVTTLMVDYSGFDKKHRKGFSGWLFRRLPADTIEYLKTVARFIRRNDRLVSLSFLWKGQRRAVKEILGSASLLVSNSVLEYNRLVEQYQCTTSCITVPNGLDAELFRFEGNIEKDENLVLCVARIEGIKNQVNLIRALNHTKYKVLIIGDHAPNQAAYYKNCRMIAAENIEFIRFMPQEDLVHYYRKAKVHVLPSWFEICGLSSLEAGAMGCNIVITEKGFTREYYGQHAFYCDPGSPASIRAAVEKAAHTGIRESLREKIINQYTWHQAAGRLAEAYHQILKTA